MKPKKTDTQNSGSPKKKEVTLNPETLEALEEVRAGKGKRFTSVSKLMKYLKSL